MEHVEVIADEVDSWTHKQGADAVLRLRGGRTLIAHTTDARFQAWSRVMSLQQETHWPVYAEYDAATRAIRLLLLCAPQHVESVESDAAGNMTVEFRRAPSFYSLKKDRQDYQAILALLTGALKTRGLVLVAVHPTTLEILCAFPGKN